MLDFTAHINAAMLLKINVRFTTRNKYIATRSKGLTSSNKKLLETRIKSIVL